MHLRSKLARLFGITSLLYNTDAILEGGKRERRVCMDRNGSEQAQDAWISVIERGVYRKKPQFRTWEFYMKPGTTVRIGGSIALVGCLFAGKRKPAPTWLFSISLVLNSFLLKFSDKV